MREILRALNHMHKQSIAHLDLKPQNILLSGEDVEGNCFSVKRPSKGFFYILVPVF